MTCPDAKTWDLLSMNLLDEGQAESLRQHCSQCERCSATSHEAARQHDDLINAFQVFEFDHDQRREQLMAMLPQSVPASTKEMSPEFWRQWLGGVVMTLKRHKLRWATVALLPAACIVAVLVFVTGNRTAFADVLEKIRHARSMVCDVVTTTTAIKGQLPDMLTKKPTRGTIAISLDGDKRAELYKYEQFGRKYRMLFTGDKAYLWDGDKIHVISTAEAVQRRPTENWLDQLLKVREAPDRNLGEQVINGRRAIGFEIAGWRMGLGTRPTKANVTPVDSESLLRVWVDVEQELPIRIEVDQQFVMPDAKGSVHSQWDNIRWNIPLDAADFQPPSQEELAKAETIQVPAVDEATFIDVMRAWVETSDKAQAGIELIKNKAKEKGEAVPPEISSIFERASLGSSYPERLDMSWLTGTFAARATLANMAETLPKLKPLPEGISKEERAKLMSERGKEGAMAGVQSASGAILKATAVAAFYRRLANEQRDPEYFGASVKPGDAKAVLLKWRLDDGRYRVIYGDLRADTIDTKN